MSKKEFLSELRIRLSPLSEEERESAVKYYEEFFDDCESDEAAFRQLGSPEEIAKQILKENGIEIPPIILNGSQNSTGVGNTPEKKTDGSKIAMSVIIIILTFPLWIGLVAAAFGILVAFAAVLFAVVAASLGVGITCFFMGLYSIIFKSFAVGIFITGIGLISLAIFMLIVIPLFKLAVGSFKRIFNTVSGWFKKIFSKGVA